VTRFTREEGNVSSIPATFKSADGYAAVMADYDRILSRWTVPYESVVVSTRYGDTYVLVSGSVDAPPLVLLHGAAVNAASWGLNVPTWSRDYRIYAPDVIGEGGRSAATRLRRDGIQETEWLHDVFDALNIESAHVVGISLGGWLALMFAAHASERVRRMVALCPASIVPLKWGFIVRGLRASLRPSDQNVRRVVHYMKARSTDFDDELLESVGLMFRHTHLNLHRPRLLSDDELRRIHAPTLLLIGEREVICNPVKAIQRARRLIPNVCAEIVPATGHALNIEQAQMVNERVLAFLQTVP
jgi:pimeloyl-ACP methyl ester carboxylesterase